MTSSIAITFLLTIGLLGVLFVARRLDRKGLGADWLIAWSVLYISALLHVNPSQREAEIIGLIAVVATLHSFFLFGGARGLATGRPTPWLLSIALVVGTIRGSLWVAGYEIASALFYAPFVLYLTGAGAWLIWSRARKNFQSERLPRVVAVAMLLYGLAYACIVVAPPLGLHMVELGVAWMLFGMTLFGGQLVLSLRAAQDSERVLIDSNSRLSSLIESSSDFVAWADGRGFVRYGNRALRDLIGDEQMPEDDLGSGVFLPRLSVEALYTEIEGRRMRESILPVVEKTGLWEGETVLVGLDGREIPVSAVVIAERNPMGEVVAIGLLMRSLSTRLAAEKDLQRRYELERFVSRLAADLLGHSLSDSEEAIEHALRNIHERYAAQKSAIYARGVEGEDLTLLFEVTGASEGALGALMSREATPRLLAKMRIGSAVHTSAVDLAVAEEVRALGVEAPSCAVIPLLHGDDLLGTLVLESPRSGDAEELGLGLLSELLACALSRRNAWQFMRRRDDEVRHAQRLEAVGQLAGGIAHDFNNSLTVISGYAEDLLQTPLDDEQRESLSQISVASERAASLTSQLLAFSRNQELVPQVFDLNERLRELQRMLRRVVGEQFRIRTELDLRAAARICADPVQIDQVVTNLVINARDAMNAGGEVHISTEVGSSNVWLLVSDDGRGMDEETRRRAFEPFFTTKSAGMGTGLGLSTVYGVIKQSGGRVSIDSAPGSGTTVTISLPLVGASSELEGVAVPEKAGHPSAAQLPGERRTILLVEDEELVRRLTQRTLERAGFTVITANDGGEALEVALEPSRKIDFILSDVVMPNMSGPEFVRSLRQQDQETPVLFMSGYPNHPSQALSLPDGAVLIEKPFTSSALLSRIGELLDGSAWAVQTGAHNLLAFRKR